MPTHNKHAYISYSRRADTSFIQQLLDTSASLKTLKKTKKNAAEIIDMDAANASGDETQDDWEIHFDENTPLSEDSIRRFMDELSEAPHIIILLSEGYFASPYCMTELLQIYNKRAHELLPVVVFVDGYLPEKNVVEQCVEHWQNEVDKKHQENNLEAVQLYEDFVQELPLTITWLLGGYDAPYEGYDTLFRVAHQDEQIPAVAKKVVEALKIEHKPRFRIISKARKIKYIEDEVKRLIRFESLKPFYIQLLETLDCDTLDELPNYISILSDSQKIKNTLNAIYEWLKENIADNPDISEKIKNLLVINTKVLVGLVLLSVFDEKKLTLLIHVLNKEKHKARLELKEDNAGSLSLLVSGIVFSLVEYRLSSGQLTGKHELILTDQGSQAENSSKKTAQEAEWLGLCNEIYNKMSDENPKEKQQHKTIKSVHEAIAERAEEGYRMVKGEYRFAGNYYLRLDKTYLDITKASQFLTDFAERHPYIQQVIFDTSRSHSIESYCLENMKPGAYYDVIKRIYEQINKIAQ